MKYLIVISLLIVAIFSDLSYSETVVRGAVSGDWTVEGSPFIIVDTTWVSEGATLTINPGVIVYFMPGLSLDVFGTINAAGTEEDSIIFSIHEDHMDDESWRGIYMWTPGTSHRFTYCSLKNRDRLFRLYNEVSMVVDHCDMESLLHNIAGTPGGNTHGQVLTVRNSRLHSTWERGNAAIVLQSSSMTISNCAIEAVGSIAIWCGSLRLEDSDIIGGVQNGGYGHISYTNCILITNRNNWNGDYRGRFEISGNSGGMIGCDVEGNIVVHRGQEQFIDDCTITGTHFRGGGMAGLMYNSSLTFDDMEIGNRHGFNTIRKCQLSGDISFEPRTEADVDSCVINSRITVWDETEVSIERSVLIGNLSVRNTNGRFDFINNTCINRDIPMLTLYGIGEQSLINNIFIALKDSSEMFRFWADEEDCNPDFRYNCIWGFDYLMHRSNRQHGFEYELHESNFSEDPLFVSLDPLDPHIRHNSPCIDSGDPDTWWDPDFTPADIGAFYFHQEMEVVKELTSPSDFRLFSAYPNPFNSTINLTYTIPHPGQITMSLIDSYGRTVSLIESGWRNEGNHSIGWSADRLPSGSYFIRLNHNDRQIVRRIDLIR